MAINVEALKERLARMNNQGRGRQGNSDLWKPDLGKYIVRAIPWPETIDVGDTKPILERWFYYNIGRRCVAPRLGEPDPVRELRDTLFAERTEANLAMARKLKPKMRCFLPVIVESEDGKSKEVKIWSFSSTVYRQLLGYIVDPDYGDFTDPDTGRDITVEITNSGKKFEDGTPIKDIDVRPKPTPRKLTKAERDLFKEIPDVDSIYPVQSYEQLEEALDRYLNVGTSGRTQTRGGPARSNGVEASSMLSSNDVKASTGSSLDDAFDDLLA